MIKRGGKQNQVNRPKKEERIKRVMELIGQGKMTFQIREICQKEWGVCTRTVERYLTIVYSFLDSSMKEKDKDKILLEYEQLISAYQARGDHKLAKEYRQMRDKILGLYQNKVDVTSGGEKLPSIINIINPGGDKL